MNARVAALLLVPLLSACSAPNAVRGLDGARHEPLRCAAGWVHVLVFTSHECPIANAYAPALQQLAASWRGRPVRLFLVHVDPDLDAATAAAHARDYELPGTVVLDPTQSLARAVGALRTPEAAVWTEQGLHYRGRIDDSWAALGSRSPEPSSHDLRDAVACVLAGRRVASATTPVVGCLLPEPRR